MFPFQRQLVPSFSYAHGEYLVGLECICVKFLTTIGHSLTEIDVAMKK